jgi:hypothetical protein
MQLRGAPVCVSRPARSARPGFVRGAHRGLLGHSRRNRAGPFQLANVRPHYRASRRRRVLRSLRPCRLRPSLCLDRRRERQRGRRTNLFDFGRLQRRSGTLRRRRDAARNILARDGRGGCRNNRGGLRQHGGCGLLSRGRHDHWIGLRRRRNGRRRGVHRLGRSARRLDGRRFDQRLSRRRDLGRRRNRRRGPRGDLGPRRQQAERIHVALRIARHAHTEVHVRRVTVSTHGADDGSLADESAPLHADRSQVQKRRRVAERSLDRDGLAAARDRAREGHHPFGGRDDVRAARCAEIDAAVLPARIGVRTVERKWSKDRSVNRPGPGTCNRYGQRKAAQDHEDKSPHRCLLCCQI